MRREALLLVLAVALALPGCALREPSPPPATPPEDPPPPLPPEEAAALVARAGEDLPPRYGTRLVVKAANGTLLADVTTMADEEAGRASMAGRVAPSILSMAGYGGRPQADGLAAVEQAIAWDDGGAGSVRAINGVYFAGATDERPPADDPFGELAPHRFGGVPLMPDLFGFHRNATVRAATPTTHEGRAAYALDLVLPGEGAAQYPRVVLTVHADPVRPARLDVTLSERTEREGLAGARASADYLYDGNAPPFQLPEVQRRAMGLAHESNERQGQRTDPIVWTFLRSEGVPLSEVELHAKEEPREEEASLAGAPSRWSVRLDRTPHEEDRVRVAYQDHDGDGLVSQGDTLEIRGGSDGLLLRDAKTGAYVMPGPPPLLVLALWALAALALRRR